MPGLTNNTDTLSALNQIIVALNELTEATRSCCTPSYSPVRPSYPPGGSPGPNESFPPGTDEEVAARRCKAAIFLIDRVLRDFADFGNRYNLDDYYNAKLIIDPTIQGAILGFTVGFLLPPGDVGAGGLGALIGGIIGNAFVNVSIASSVIEFDSIRSFASQNRDSLICALATSTNGLAAQIAFRRIVNNSGLSLGNKTFVNGLIDTNVIALLFFVNDNYLVFEQLLESITGTCPCQDVAPGTPTTLTDEYKCKAANYIFDSFEETTANLGSLGSFAYLSIPTFINALVEGLLGTLLVGIFANLPIYAGILAAIVSRLSTLAWRGFNFFDVFSTVATSLTTDKTAIVCELYEAASATDPIATARTALEARIDTYVDTAVANTAFAVEADTFKSALKLLLSNAVLNALVEERPEITAYAPEDFQECECGIVGPECYTFSSIPQTSFWQGIGDYAPFEDEETALLPTLKPSGGLLGWSFTWETDSTTNATAMRVITPAPDESGATVSSPGGTYTITTDDVSTWAANGVRVAFFRTGGGISGVGKVTICSPGL